MFDESDYFHIHPCALQNDCYTIESGSVKTQQTFLRILEAYFKDCKDILLTTDTPREAENQFNYKRNSCENVVWEWQGDDGTWAPYSSEFISKLETAKIGESLQLKNPSTGADYVVVKNTRWCASQSRSHTNKKRDVRRRVDNRKVNKDLLEHFSAKKDCNGDENVNYSWEYEGNDEPTSPLDKDVMKQIESARVDGKIIVQIGKEWCEIEKIATDAAWQKNLYTSKTRQLVRKEAKSPKFVWEWQDSNDLFKPFDSLSSEQIEKALMMQKTEVTTKNGRYEVIKLTSSTGIQTSVLTQKVRSIRRRQVS